jgi:hypothetical protein
MAKRLFLATRKGLFRLERGAAKWNVEHVSFLGDAVSLVLPDSRDGAIYAALGLGHFGVKLRRSTDLGESWEELAAPQFPPKPDDVDEKLPDGRPWPWRVEQIWALEPGSRPGQLWCGTIGGGFFESTDSGKSWSFNRALWDHPRRKEWFGGGADMPGIHSICVHPKDGAQLLLGVSCGGVWQTADSGQQWRLTSKGMFAEFMPPGRREDEAIQDPHRIVRCPSDPTRLWAQHHNGVFRSDDSGQSWVSIDNVPPSVFGFAVAVHPSKPDTAWLVPATKDDQRVPASAAVVVSRTDDAGKTWRVQKNGLPQTDAYDLVYRHALDVDETGQTLAFASTTGSLWITENGGDQWSEISTHLPPVYAVRFA